MTSPKPMRALATLGMTAIMLWACGPVATDADNGETATVEDSNDTLAGVLGNMEDSDRIREAVEESGLSSLMDGSGIYTLLAPEDAAFEALGARGDLLLEEGQRPMLVGVLREHILPGHVTPEAIATAIEQQDGAVEMTTYGGGTVTFSREEEAITITDSSGASARFAGPALAASNGTVIPIDTVLVPEAETPLTGQ
ncbi:fasciclin domain-containing protein [Qipengyuania sp. MTN3-11]|uniref:fasciclin domain-containing protein n=1 Tax=Qipengyuania sp. MTN3-11 TaxID=3056557 RepID=UPI0036F2D80F